LCVNREERENKRDASLLLLQVTKVVVADDRGRTAPAGDLPFFFLLLIAIVAVGTCGGHQVSVEQSFRVLFLVVLLSVFPVVFTFVALLVGRWWRWSMHVAARLHLIYFAGDAKQLSACGCHQCLPSDARARECELTPESG
jgi:hypothetical protein